ncbi:MAG: DUF4317 domain-containing protein [Ruminococcaceae bacterium]|nr:DUF4317 domain-containing protein [Oscillospiraceae bacterium]
MTEKEIAELRRRLRTEKNNITNIRGCYVTEKGEIIATFDQGVGLMQQEDADRFFALLKKVMSGQQGKNLIDVEFSVKQVMEGEEHKRLVALRECALKDDEQVKALFELIAANLHMEGSYVILLAYDTYDVRSRSKNMEEMEDDSENMYSYILCSICPIKPTKPTLGYVFSENEIHTLKENWVVASPALGFLFPAFDDRATNLYNLLYYTQDAADSHTELSDVLFGTELPMPAAEQRNTFGSMLSETLEEQCSFEVVQAVHEQLCGIIEAHKESKSEEPLAISRTAVSRVLDSCGVSQEHVAAFDERYAEVFGEDTDISPRNVVDTRRFEVTTPDVVIHVAPERSDLIETRVIDGTRYILICADAGVEVNGVAVSIKGEE